MKKEKKKYLAWGLTAFLTGCALLIFYDVFYRDNSGTVQAIFAKLFSVLTPVLYGLGMAYLLAPIVNFLERAILRLRDKLERKRSRAIRIHKGWLRAASIFLTWAVVLVLVYLLLSMLVPQLVDSITSAGSVFLGDWSPESAGDYASGTNHVLPTYGYTATCSSLGLADFQKRMTVQELSRDGFAALASTIEILAAAERLDAHKNAVTLRVAALKEQA